MKSLIIALSLAAVASVSFARAAKAPSAAASDPAATTTASATEGTQPGTPQRTRMKTCNADARAKDIHGPDRRAFMKQCLSNKTKTAAAS